MGRTSPLGRAAEQIGRDRQFPSALRNQLRNRNKKQDGGVEKKLHTRGDQYKGLKVQMQELQMSVSVCGKIAQRFPPKSAKMDPFFFFFEKKAPNLKLKL